MNIIDLLATLDTAPFELNPEDLQGSPWISRALPAAFEAFAAFDLVSFTSFTGGALTGGPEEPFFGGVVGLLEDNSLEGLSASIGPLSSVAPDPPWS